MFTQTRLEKLELLRKYIQQKLEREQEVNLIFVCVQNSRRSHLSQVIAQYTAYEYQIDKINCYSGGVEVTSIHPNTVAILRKLGFEIIQKIEGENPVFEWRYKPSQSIVLLYSKNFEEVTSRLEHFAAVMVCTETENNCPYIPGAEHKIFLPYDDPKTADNSENPLDAYLRVAHQMQEEMRWIFSNI